MKYIFFRAILLADSRPTFLDKIYYYFNVICAFAPIVYVMDGLNWWFNTNKQFSAFLLFCLAINMFVGFVFHLKAGSFSWPEMLIKNAVMWGVLIIVYTVLEMLRLTIGNNSLGDGFKILIQTTTLLYPISKILKNAYIFSNKQFPPEFIMNRIYNFEKDGNISDLFKNDKTE